MFFFCFSDFIAKPTGAIELTPEEKLLLLHFDLKGKKPINELMMPISAKEGDLHLLGLQILRGSNDNKQIKYRKLRQMYQDNLDNSDVESLMTKLASLQEKRIEEAFFILVHHKYTIRKLSGKC